MLIVTEQAKAVLDGKIDDAVRSAGQTLRLTEEQPGTLGLKYDTLSESDQVVKLEGAPGLAGRAADRPSAHRRHARGDSGGGGTALEPPLAPG